MIAQAARDTGFSELPVRAAVAARVADLPPHHRDPFDRLLVAQAMPSWSCSTRSTHCCRLTELVRLVG